MKYYILKEPWFLVKIFIYSWLESLFESWESIHISKIFPFRFWIEIPQIQKQWVTYSTVNWQSSIHSSRYIIRRSIFPSNNSLTL